MTIDRKLVRIEHDGEWTEVEPDRIGSIFDPAMILGDPGMGKTTLLRRLCEERGMTYIHAADVVRAEDPRSLVPEDGRAVVDGLDETASPGTGSAVGAALRRLREAECRPEVLACRAGEWRGAVDLARIEDAYAGEPVVLYLPHFGDDEARTFLAQEFPGTQVHALLRHLENGGLARACRNPLVLRLFGECVRGGYGLPETRAELLERACRAMVRQDAGGDVVRLVRLDEDDLLLAAGAVCATLLLCNLSGVHDGPPAETAAGFLNVAGIAGLPLAGAAADVLATRLFRAEGEGHFSYFHRVVAEYLGARWLTRCVDQGLSQDRILGLFVAGGGPGCFPVPTALRGLHAWLAHLGPALAGGCIAADPHAVLRDGETETLDLDRARALLAALKQRSGEDPCWDAEDRNAHPAFGLMRQELKGDIIGMLAVPGRHAEAAALVADAMGGTDLCTEAVWTLKGMVFDRAREHGERFMAMNSLRLAGALDDKEGTVLRLLDMGDAVSARLACELLAQWGDDVVHSPPASPTGKAALRLVAGSAPEPAATSVELSQDDPFVALDAARLAAVLDGITAGVPAMMAKADVPERSAFTDLVRRLAARVLEGDPTVAPKRVWAWIGWTRPREGEGRGARERLAEVFRGERALRAGLLAHVLVTPRLGGPRMGCRELEATGLGLDPERDDLAGVLASLPEESTSGAADPDLRDELTRLIDAADGMAAMERSDAPAIEMPDAKPTADNREDLWRDARPSDGHSLRESLSREADRIAAGDVRVLAAPAAVYLGRSDALDEPVAWDPSVPPAERLRDVLGTELSERVLDGFIAVLGREDLPGAEEIAQIHCTGGEHEAEAPLICGIAVALCRGLSCDAVEQATLEAAYMASERAPECAAGGRLSIDPALEEMVLRSSEDIGRHLRASIEPQLAHDVDFVRDIDRLSWCSGFGELPGRLSVEWLRAYPAVNGDTQAELLLRAFENAPREAVRDVVVDRRERLRPDDRSGLLWLAVASVVDLDGSRDALMAAAETSADFLGHVRDVIGDKNRIRFADTPLASLVFVVEAFGRRWPRVPERPGDEGKGRHWNDPRDASAFIERTIHAIANRPQPEATEALRNLIENHAPSYAGTLKRALAFQRRARRDFEHEISTVEGFRALMAETPNAAGEHAGWTPGSAGGGA